MSRAKSVFLQVLVLMFIGVAIGTVDAYYPLSSKSPRPVLVKLKQGTSIDDVLGAAETHGMETTTAGNAGSPSSEQAPDATPADATPAPPKPAGDAGERAGVDGPRKDENGIIVENASELPEGHITVAQAYRLFQRGGVDFIDARIDLDYEEGHIPGAVHIPVSMFDSGTPTEVMMLQPDTPKVVYCSGGNECEAAEDVAKLMQQSGLGFEAIFVLHAGYPGWVASGLPTEEGE